MKKHTSRVDESERNTNILRLIRPQSPQPPEVHITINSDAPTIIFEHVSHVGPTSKLTIKFIGTVVVARISMAVASHDGDGVPA